MSPLDAALWALLGAMTIEAFEILTAIRSQKAARWPWERSEVGPNLLAIALRFGIASGLGAAMSEQFDGVFAAYVIGIGAPLILARIIINLRQEDENAAKSATGEVKQ